MTDEDSEKMLADGLANMTKTLQMLTKISPKWKMAVRTALSEALGLKYAEDTDEAEGTKLLRTDADAHPGLTKAFNAEMAPRLRKRFGVTSK